MFKKSETIVITYEFFWLISDYKKLSKSAQTFLLTDVSIHFEIKEA